jgi:hypothetical protein
MVASVLKHHGNSDYLNLHEMEKLLSTHDYEKLRTPGAVSQSLIDKQRLFTDLRKKSGNKQVEKFIGNYLNTRLDVVSIAEARETVANAPTSTIFDEKL